MKDLFEFTTTDSIFFLVLVAMLLIAYFANKIIVHRHAEKMQIGEYDEELVIKDKCILSPGNYFIPSFKMAFNNLKEHEYISVHVDGVLFYVNLKDFAIFEDTLFSVVTKYAGDINKQIFIKLDKITSFEVMTKREEEKQ